MTSARDLLLHVQNAMFGYGSDLLLAVPGGLARKAEAAASTAATPTAKPRPEAATGPEPMADGWTPRFGRGSKQAQGAVGSAAAANPAAIGPAAIGPARIGPATTVPAAAGPAAAGPAAAGAPMPVRPAPAAAAAANATDPAAPLAGATGLDALRQRAMACQQCKLCATRRSVVFGEGNERPAVLFVGEAPGAVEDQTGRPFVGPAGQLLDRILEGAMGLTREQVYIANINKCRPPGNRDPEPDEVAACLPLLHEQIALLQPRALVALGRVAAQNLLGTDEPMRALRGRDLSYRGIPLVVTWHPAFLLRDPSRKRETWEDIKRVNRLLGRPEDPRAAAAAEA